MHVVIQRRKMSLFSHCGTGIVFECVLFRGLGFSSEVVEELWEMHVGWRDGDALEEYRVDA